jgi:hypothetical protein
MIRTFTVATGQLDSQGDIIKIDGIKMPDKIQVIETFDTSKIVGEAELKRESSTIKAIAEIPDHYLDSYPAIGFELIRYHMDGDTRVIDEMKLHHIGISANPNVDPLIKTIREQTEED